MPRRRILTFLIVEELQHNVSMTVAELRDALEKDGHDHPWDSVKYGLKCLENEGIVAQYPGENNERYYFLMEYYDRHSVVKELWNELESYLIGENKSVLKTAHLLPVELLLHEGVYKAYSRLYEALVDGQVDVESLEEEENEPENEE